MTEALLSICNLSVLIRAQCPIIANVSLDVQDGEFLSVIGPNGAGKTTLLKAMLGLCSSQAGEIFLNGKPLERYSGRERARWLGYVPQSINTGLSCTVEEFVMMGRYPHLSFLRPPGPADRAAVTSALQLTRTEHHRYRLMDTLSGGERQKVMIAGALAQQPRLLLLDEPASFLDPSNELEIQELLQTINRESGTGIIQVTHNPNHAIRASHRILGFRQGDLVFCGTPQELLANDVLSEIYGIRFSAIPVRADGAVMVFPDALLSP